MISIIFFTQDFSSLKYRIYFAEQEEKMNKMQADEGSSTFDFYKNFVNVFLYYIPINLKILKPWIFFNQHNFVALFVLTISIMILSVSYLFNTFAWKIFTKLLLLHFEFWIIWLGEILLTYPKKQEQFIPNIASVGSSLTSPN